MTRWNVLGKYMREPRGAKSAEHLEILRQSDPSLNSLSPSIWQLLPNLVQLELEGRRFTGGFDDFSTLDELRALRSTGTAPLPLEESGWRLLQPAKKTLQPAKKTLQPAKKTFNFDSFDEYTDDESSESGDGVPELPDGLMRHAGRNSARFSNASDDSERSGARTMERASNDSVASLLEDDFPELEEKEVPLAKPDLAAKLAMLASPKGRPQPPINPHAGWRVR